MPVESFTDFARNLFIRTTTECEISRNLVEKLLDAEFTPTVTTVATCARSLAVMFVKECNTFFVRRRRTILGSEEEAAVFALSCCLTLNKNPSIENFVLTCGFLSEFAIFRFEKKPCYRIIHIVSQCLLSLYRRRYPDRFEQEGLRELLLYSDNVNRLVEAAEGRSGDARYAFDRNERLRMKNLIKSCAAFSAEEVVLNEVEIASFGFIESEPDLSDEDKSDSSSVDGKESESSSSSEQMSEGSGSPVAEDMNIPESGNSSSDHTASSGSKDSTDAGPSSLALLRAVRDLDDFDWTSAGSARAMQGSAGAVPGTSTASNSEMPSVAGPSMASDYGMPGVPDTSANAAGTDDVFRGEDVDIYFEKYNKANGGYICAYCLSNCAKYLGNL